MQTEATEATGNEPPKPPEFRYYCGLPDGCSRHFNYPSLDHGKPPCPHCGNLADYDPLPEPQAN